MISEGRLHDGLFSRLVPDCPPLTAQRLRRRVFRVVRRSATGPALVRPRRRAAAMRGAALRSSIPPANARPPRRTERTSGRANLGRAATASGEAAKPLSPREQPRETSAAARAAVVVGPRAHPRLLSPHRANAAPVRGTRERTRTAFGSSITLTRAPAR